MSENEEPKDTPAPPATAPPPDVHHSMEEAGTVDKGGKVEESPKGGCRQCCTYPHGRNALIACIIATLAWIFTLVATNDCHFLHSNYMYCHPPPPKEAPFGTCGDCHCINGDDPCPSDPNEIPLTDLDDDWLRQLKRMEATNPYSMVCNPYQTHNQSCTSPAQSQEQIDLWETAVCGLTYDMDTLDEDQCPTQYSMQTYNSEAEMEAAGAVMTHWGACGACSTTKDMAVYVEFPDLTEKGQECGVRGLINTTDGIKCFEEVGYTPACAEAWMFNVFNTRDHCFDVCIDFTFFGDGKNNGPPPECRIANCLLCDEEMSGVVFQTEAARSRRRTGLLSKIARPCDVILIVDHQNPCNVTREKIANGARYLQSSQKPETPEKWRAPEPKETCVYVEEDLGIGGYAVDESNQWLPAILLSADDQVYDSFYSTCKRYSFSKVVSGFWAIQRDIFGAAYRGARAMALIAILVGVICLSFMWASACIAYAQVFWKWMAGLLALCGLCAFLTLVFFASDVCQYGCQFGQSAVFAIVAGILWWAAAFYCFRTGPFDKSQPRAKTCCMPEVVEDTGAYPGAYKAVPTSEEPERTDISVTETVQSDGSVVMEKVTTYPNGAKSVEITTTHRAPAGHGGGGISSGVVVGNSHEENDA